MTHPYEDRPMGKKELAELLDVKTRTAHVWDDRHQLPPPDEESVNGLKAWRRSTLLMWALRTGRGDRLSPSDLADAHRLLADVGGEQ